MNVKKTRITHFAGVAVSWCFTTLTLPLLVGTVS